MKKFYAAMFLSTILFCQAAQAKIECTQKHGKSLAQLCDTVCRKQGSTWRGAGACNTQEVIEKCAQTTEIGIIGAETCYCECPETARQFRR